MNKRKKPKEKKVEVVSVAVIGKRKPAEGTTETNQETQDFKLSFEIIDLIDELIKLRHTIMGCLAARRNAEKRIKDLTKKSKD